MARRGSDVRHDVCVRHRVLRSVVVGSHAHLYTRTRTHEHERAHTRTHTRNVQRRWLSFVRRPFRPTQPRPPPYTATYATTPVRIESITFRLIFPHFRVTNTPVVSRTLVTTDYFPGAGGEKTDGFLISLGYTIRLFARGFRNAVGPPLGHRRFLVTFLQTGKVLLNSSGVNGRIQIRCRKPYTNPSDSVFGFVVVCKCTGDGVFDRRLHVG